MPCHAMHMTAVSAQLCHVCSLSSAFMAFCMFTVPVGGAKAGTIHSLPFTGSSDHVEEVV